MDIRQIYEENLVKYGGRGDVTTCLEFSLEGVKAHMTISYLNDKDNNPNFFLALESFVKLSGTFPQTEVTVIGYDNFGPRKNIPVLLVEVKDVNPLLTFHNSFGQTEPGMNKFFTQPSFHISLKFNDQARFRNLPLGTKLTPTKICMKRLGNVPEFYIKQYL